MAAPSTFGALDARPREKKGSNRFHLMPIGNGRDRSPSPFNLKFNRRTLNRTELRELSPHSSTRASSQSYLDRRSQTCWVNADAEAVRAQLSQWQFPEVPIPNRQITWGPYVESTINEDIHASPLWLKTPQNMSTLEPVFQFPPSPTSLKRPRTQMGLQDERQTLTTHDVRSRDPKRARRKLSDTSESESEPSSSKSFSPTSHRLEQVCSLLGDLAQPPSPYSVECSGCFFPQSENHPALTFSNAGCEQSCHYDPISPVSPTSSASRGTYQTFSWYRPPPPMINQEQTQHWWDQPPPPQPFRF